VKEKTLILVAGPTASGKTSCALELARSHKTSIISADSRQCFKELNIGVAKPSPAELAEIRHYFINTHSIHDTVNAMTFAEYANNALNEIFRSNNIAVMAGGTGLYIKAFLEGFDDIPDVPSEIRNRVKEEYELKGREWLQKELQEKDPVYYEKGEIMNPQRMMRALEVKLATGRSIREFQRASAGRRHDFLIKNITLSPPRETLYRNINQRVEEMMEKGLLEEARALLPFRHLNALQTVGYTELFDYFDGKYSLPEAVEKIKQNTRNYAKRQLTWLRKVKS
jgi:tRNA dimethylallyltransferase